MELYLLRTFVTVAEQRQLTKAAVLLRLSQPAVSGQIKALEEQLELKLFERGPSGVCLTKAGEALFPHAKAVIGSVLAFSNTARALEGHLTGQARLGTVLDPGVIRLGPFMTTLLEHHPWLELTLQHGISTWAIDGVSNGTLDGGFFLSGEVYNNVRVMPLDELTYRVVAPIAWASRVEGMDVRRIAALPWIRPPRHSPHELMQQAIFDPMGLTPATVIEADQELSISTLVKAGLGLGLMREDLARAAAVAGEICIWERVAPTTRLSFGYARGREGDVVIRALLDAVKAVWGRPEIEESTRLVRSHLTDLPASNL